jgi:hypothetical protein
MKIITVDTPFQYKHISVIESFGSSGDSVRMKAEVGLLTRNIGIHIQLTKNMDLI